MEIDLARQPVLGHCVHMTEPSQIFLIEDAVIHTNLHSGFYEFHCCLSGDKTLHIKLKLKVMLFAFVINCFRHYFKFMNI